MSASVFPARAGMSRESKPNVRSGFGVPRASGDEPQKLTASKIAAVCSPRERG